MVLEEAVGEGGRQVEVDSDGSSYIPACHRRPLTWWQRGAPCASARGGVLSPYHAGYAATSGGANIQREVDSCGGNEGLDYEIRDALGWACLYSYYP